MRRNPFRAEQLAVSARKVFVAALAEDRHREDITSKALLGADKIGTLELVAKQGFVCCGVSLAAIGFRLADKTCSAVRFVKDGEPVAKGAVLLAVRGRLRPLLAAERSVLNLLQFLSAIADQTRDWRRKIPKKIDLLATRKTIPGLRLLSKYAVAVGGGNPHRMDLAELAMIKDNHLQAVGDASVAVEKLRLRGYKSFILECDDLKQLETALQIKGVKHILLDNMTPEQLRRAVKLNKGRVFLEASGGITSENLSGVAASGVDAISVGCLTQNPPRVDISCRLVKEESKRQ